MCSLYREEALEAIIAALDCQLVGENIQEQVARSLLMLGGHFLLAGEPVTEQWLLQKSGFPEDPDMALHAEDTVVATTMPRVSALYKLKFKFKVDYLRCFLGSGVQGKGYLVCLARALQFKVELYGQKWSA